MGFSPMLGFGTSLLLMKLIPGTRPVGFQFVLLVLLIGLVAGMALSLLLLYALIMQKIFRIKTAN